MRLPSTPLGWALAALAVLLAISLIVRFWSGLTSWLPWSAESQRDRAVAERDLAQADAAARGLEVEGERAQAERLETFHTSEILIRDLTATAEAQARSAPDANEPLDSDRAGRLHDHDRGLCALSPAICGAAAPDLAFGGDDALPSAATAGRADPG